MGGKALALAALSRAGLRIPDFFCVTTDAYRAFQDTTGMRGRILHESYVNIRGTEAVVEHVRMVWASLWSDAAPLDPGTSDGRQPRVAWWASVSPLSSKKDLIVTQRISLSMCARKSLRWG